LLPPALLCPARKKSEGQEGDDKEELVATADSSPSVCGQKMMKDKLRQEEEDWKCCFFLCAIIYSTIASSSDFVATLCFSLSTPDTMQKTSFIIMS
jgi:hypothetical protein